MSDDFWSELKAFSKHRKKELQAKAPSMISIVQASPGVRLKKLSEYHYRINDHFDWWPTSGIWIELGRARVRGHGIRSLLEAVNSSVHK